MVNKGIFVTRLYYTDNYRNIVDFTIKKTLVIPDNGVQKRQINASLDTKDNKDLKKDDDCKPDDPTKEDSKPPEDQTQTEDIGECKKWTDFICGIPDVAEENNLEEEIEQRKAFFKENQFWTRVLNINAWIAVVVLAFMIGFFS